MYRLRIELNGIEPMVWRRIEVPSSYTFYDLHVAIQDAMGWLDYHQHEFELQRGSRGVRIGIPGEFVRETVRASWEVPLADYLSARKKLTYLYDFGDDWDHTIHVEAVTTDDSSESLPRCVAGENATPPEDCGGPPGYSDLKAVLAGPKNAEYRNVREWLKNGHAKCYWVFDPFAFDIAKVAFRDPSEQLKAVGGD